ncbi:mitochondrial import receptor subunit TOM40 homolog 1-like isoform X2 [Artemia franciscana]|uniref:mitochondrial import receptor subunit TOM40 homolog 1-like isoform X2 n=1 Tax=Artemia franciscana TaxID=6661 RepID=UPI0032DB3DCD
MGNVMAASPSMPVVEVADAKDKKSDSTNPGTVEELHKKCKDVQPSNFEGAKLLISKGLSNHFQISHTMSLSSTVPSTYKFGATYVGTNIIGPGEAYPILLGEIDPDGDLSANIIHGWNNIKMRLVSQVQQNKFVATQFSTEYKSNDYSTAITVANPDVVNGSAPTTESCFTIGLNNIHLSHYKKCSEQLQIGVEMETRIPAQESVATIGYQVDLPKINLTARGMVDTNWNVGIALERKLVPLPFTFILSGRLNHVENKFQLGCGLMVG